MSTHENSPTIILVPGHWLGAWAWDEVVEQLQDAGHRAVPLTLPGLDPHDPQRATRTLDDQADAIDRALESAAASGHGPAVLVAHSGANAPVSIVLDRHPELVGHVIWVDSGPVAPGTVFAPDAPADLVELPLPAFDVLGEQASLDGLDAGALDRFREGAVPEPGPVLRQAVELANAERLDVPTTLVCCSISGEQIRELAAAGHPMFAEVAGLRQVESIDLPTGHWPMWSRPQDLAEIIAAVATSQPLRPVVTG
ncbi:pimeloyl-ACP methyl ester carboxylesterase [Microbacterium resistens]|uniref:Pimeloyl-ACP methyl ester carboxylesterase n=1 Tax=Microbacterium resistens TaxID=156977 RepID=A0ABU1SHA1_9MICO|nr:alpha/beta hydrolase [Microbacterium resistens]MDR6868996.1 pimeloyl-ACP methyl ester carboxylesterase [Microbacterium resistens]